MDRNPTNIPKLKAEAMERAAIELSKADGNTWNMSHYRRESNAAITAYLSHIAQGISEEDVVNEMAKALEKALVYVEYIRGN